MQEPIYHLYFHTTLEHLDIQCCDSHKQVNSLSSLCVAAKKVIENLKAAQNEELLLLLIELQAIIQVLLKILATDVTNCRNSNIRTSLDEINW